MKTFSSTILLLTGGVRAFSPPSANTKLVSPTVRSSTALGPYSHLSPEEMEIKLNELRNSYGEKSRKFRRSFFVHDDWVKHRAVDRFPGIFVKFLKSGLVRQLAPVVGFITSIAAFVVAWNCLLVTGYDDFQGIHHDPFAILSGLTFPLMALPATPFTFSSPALALLLVFRTNVGYQRWDEARKAWGIIVNHSRNLLRQGASWVTKETEPDPEIRRQKLEFFCDSVWAFARSMQRHLWGFHEDDAAFQRDVRERLGPREAEGLIAARHKPTRANHNLSRAINELPLTYLRRIEIDKSAIEFANAMGACDRILTSPVPLFYTRHTARFLALWLLAMPLALWDSFAGSWNRIGMIPTVAIISFFFFGIEELSLVMEEPFTILPLDKITNGIGLSCNEHLAWHFEAEKEKSHQSSLYSKLALIIIGCLWRFHGKLGESSLTTPTTSFVRVAPG